MKYQNQNPFDKLHPDEPWFFIRAQDKHAPEAIKFYADLLWNDGDRDGAFEVLHLLKCLEEWQSENPDKVKSPD